MAFYEQGGAAYRNWDPVWHLSAGKIKASGVKQGFGSEAHSPALSE